MAYQQMTVKKMMELLHGSSSEQNWYLVKGTFLDSFYSNPRIELLEEEPEIYDNIPIEIYSFVACMVHWLCNRNKFQLPEWTLKKIYFLDEPFFGSSPPKGKLRGLMTANSPIEFVFRNVFTLPSTMSRA